MRDLALSVLDTFDSNARLTWSVTATSQAIARFDTATSSAGITFTEAKDGEWHVRVDVEGAKDNSTMNFLSDFIRTSSGVFQAIREFLEVRQPEQLIFGKQDRDLAELYEAYLERRDTSLHTMGYQMASPSGTSALIHFLIQKKTASEWLRC